MDACLRPTPVEASETDAVPFWAAGVVRTQKAPPNSGREWTSDTCFEHLVVEACRDDLGIHWLQAPGLYIVQVDSCGDVESAIELRRRVNDATAMFVLAGNDSVELGVDVQGRLALFGISVSHHHHGPSSRDNAALEMLELCAAQDEGIENLRCFWGDIAQALGKPSHPG